jgi:hypothetical protein
MALTRRGSSFIAAVAVIAAFALPTSASAAVTCSFDSGTGVLTVAVTNGTPTVAIRDAASPSLDIQVDDASDFSTPLSCTNGPPTLSTTSSIMIDETGSSQGTTARLDFANGRLSPGTGDTETGTAEIEISYSADTTGNDQFQINGPTESADQHFDFGAVGGSVQGNLNNDDDIDDVTLNSAVDTVNIQPGTGNDTITTDGSAPGGFTGTAPLAGARVLGSAGNDTFHAGGLAGSDNRLLEALTSGNDTMTGGPGNDSMGLGAGNDFYDAGGGSADFVDDAQFPTPITLDLSQTGPQDTGTAGIDTVVNAENIVGGNASDVLTGNAGPNVIFGGNNPGDAGSDVLNGAGGNDKLTGWDGNDLLMGGTGNDQLEGDAGTDTASFALGSTGGVNFSLNQGLTGTPQNTIGAGSDTLLDGVPFSDGQHEIENLIGSPFGGDVLTGNSTANQIDVYDGLSDTVDCVDTGDGDIATADEIGVDALTNCETIDNAPQTFIDSGPADGATVATRTPTYDVSSDEPADFQVSVDSGGFQACSASCTVPTLSDGAHTIAFRAVDQDENMHPDLSPATRTVIVSLSGPPDTTPPETNVSGRTKVKTRKKKARVSFTFSSSEAGSTFACSLDGAPFAPCASPFTAKLRRGAHTLTVRASDPSGNTDPTPATFTTKVKRKRR